MVTSLLSCVQFLPCNTAITLYAVAERKINQPAMKFSQISFYPRKKKKTQILHSFKCKCITTDCSIVDLSSSLLSHLKSNHKQFLLNEARESKQSRHSVVNIKPACSTYAKSCATSKLKTARYLSLRRKSARLYGDLIS